MSDISILEKFFCETAHNTPQKKLGLLDHHHKLTIAELPYIILTVSRQKSCENATTVVLELGKFNR